MKTLFYLLLIVGLCSFSSVKNSTKNTTQFDELPNFECYEVAVDMYNGFVNGGIDKDRALDISAGYYELCASGYFDEE